MNLDLDTVRELALAFRPRRYIRAIPKLHEATPLGMGYGRSRFSSPTDAFRLLYIAEGLATALAETIVRDRFEGVADRVLDVSEIEEWSVVETSVTIPLTLVDLRTTGLLRLGVSTDAARAKMHGHGQELAAALYVGFDVDGLLYSSRLTGGICVAVFDRASDPPPLNWSTLNYVFWQTGGPRCRRSATSPKRSSRSCVRSMSWSRRARPSPMRSARSA